MSVGDRVVSSGLSETAIDLASVDAWSQHLGRPVRHPGRLRAVLGSGDLPTVFARTARRRADHEALRIDDSSISHLGLERAAASLAGALHSRAVGPGSVVMVAGPASVRMVAHYLAVLRVGAAVVFASAQSTRHELEVLSEASTPDLFVASGEVLGRLLELDPSVDVVGIQPEDATDCEVLDGSYHDPVGAVAIDPDSPAILAFTSGTTGTPKCAPLSHRNLLASIRGVMSAWRWTETDHVVHSLPITHQHGLGAIHAALISGGQCTVLPSLDVARLMDEIRSCHGTVLFGVPAIYERLLADPGFDPVALRSLRLFTSGSGPLATDLAERVRAAAGSYPLERYGSTEAGLDVSNPIGGPRLTGHVGLPLPGVEVAVADGHAKLPDGEAGEIVIRGPQVFAGYRGLPSEDVLDHGWFRTGDIGVVDSDSGYLRIVGRSKDLIITGGMNVYPREVEEVIRTVAGVSDVAVVGVPSGRWGEEVVAFVSPTVAPERAVTDKVTAMLAPYKRPKRILRLDAIPRTAMGKVVSDRLIALATEAVDESNG